MAIESMSNAIPPLSGASVLSLSIEPWDSVWRSRHHVMSRLGRNNKVLFSSLPPHLGEARTALRDRQRPRTASIPIGEQLREYVHSPWLPVNYRSPLVESWVEQLRRRRLRREMHRLGMSKPVLYIWHPCFVDSVGAYDESLVVFHCYDEYSAFAGTDGERERLLEQEERLVRRADVVFAASESLASARRRLNSNVHVVENGVDYDLFARACDPTLAVPPAMSRLSGPIIGCVLTQLTVVDVPMLVEVLAARPSWQFAIIGMDRPVDAGGDPVMTRLLASPNLHFLGRQPLTGMPAFLKGCDVCAIPWVVNDITAASSSPLKLYEYFAAGKPIVSAKLPLLQHLSGLVEFARSADEWVASIERALRNDGSDHITRRQDLARSNTWDRRVVSISEVLVSALAQREARPRQR